MIPYEDFGGTGPLLHFAHPNAYPPAVFRQFLQPLTADYDVLAMAQRPLWPGSRPDEMHDWQLFADDLVDFLADHDLHGIIGVGHSLGAVATMMAAVGQPQLFRALVLIEPVFLPRCSPAGRRRTAGSAGAVTVGSSCAQTAQFLARPRSCLCAFSA